MSQLFYHNYDVAKFEWSFLKKKKKFEWSKLNNSVSIGHLVHCAVISTMYHTCNIKIKKLKIKNKQTACSLCSLYHHWEKYKEMASATSWAQRSSGWNILLSLIQKSKVVFFPNASHVKGLWKYKKEFKTSKNREKGEKLRNHSSGDGKKKEKKEKKKKEEEIEAEDEDEGRD